MTPRERVLAALAGQMPDRVPFVIWNNKLPSEEVTSRLLKLDACIINKSTVYTFTTPAIQHETEHLESIAGFARIRKTFHTAASELTIVERIVPGTVWLEKMPFCGPDDYEPLEAYIAGKVYEPCHDKFLADDSRYGDRSLARPEKIYTPIQDLICEYMGVQQFCVEWQDRRSRLLKLCEIIAADRQKRLELVATSPARYVIIEGNVIPEVIGPERFEKYHVPYIETACELLHKNNKKAGAHFDANNNIIADIISRTSLDLIESFTPPPDCNLPLSEARRLWPDKTIQINFPSSLHLAGPNAVRRQAARILKEAAPGDRFIIGVSEDISGGGRDTLVPLAEAVRESGLTPIPEA